VTPSRSYSVVDMGELQLEVLDRLTQLGEGTVYDVLDRFDDTQRPRYTTVLTVLRNLERKGLVAHRKQDRAYMFRPTDEAGGVRRRILRSVLDRVFGGSPRAMVAALLDVEDATPETLQELKALIAEREQ
jgi:BlaI family penicillinase repressor